MITQKNYSCDNPVQAFQALRDMAALDAYKEASAVLLQVYVQIWEKDLIVKTIATAKKVLPKAVVIGMTNYNNEVYTFTIFDLSDIETSSLINKMTKHFHLTNRQESLALAA